MWLCFIQQHPHVLGHWHATPDVRGSFLAPPALRTGKVARINKKEHAQELFSETSKTYCPCLAGAGSRSSLELSRRQNSGLGASHASHASYASCFVAHATTIAEARSLRTLSFSRRKVVPVFIIKKPETLHPTGSFFSWLNSACSPPCKAYASSASCETEAARSPKARKLTR